MYIYDNYKALKAEIEKVSANHDLSAEGKQKATAKHYADIQSIKPQLYSQLKRDWQRIKSKCDEIQAERLELIEKAAQKWDYQRLNYHAEILKHTLANVHDNQELANAWAQVKASHDQHQKKAWAELAPAIALTKFGIDAGPIISEMKRTATDINKIPDDEGLKLDGDLMINDALELERFTNELEKDLRVNPDLFTYEDEKTLSDIRGGLALRQAIDPADGRIKTTLDF